MMKAFLSSSTQMSHLIDSSDDYFGWLRPKALTVAEIDEMLYSIQFEETWERPTACTVSQLEEILWTNNNDNDEWERPRTLYGVELEQVFEEVRLMLQE